MRRSSSAGTRTDPRDDAPVRSAPAAEDLPGDASWATLLLPFAKTVSLVEAPVRYLRLRVLQPRVLDSLASLDLGAMRILRRERIARRVHRAWKKRLAATPCTTPSPAIRVEYEARLPAGGFLVAMFHSRWIRIFMRELAAREAPLVVARGPLSTQHGDLRAELGLPGMRRVVGHLRAGGRSIITMDHFRARGGRAMKFLGFDVRASRGAVELARHARVPIVPTWSSLAGDRFVLRMGRPLAVGESREALRAAHEELMAYFEGQVQREPESWTRLFRFLRERHGLRAIRE